MINGTLEMHMRLTRKIDSPRTTSQLGADGKWRLCKASGRSIFQYQITEYDDDGLKYLQSIQEKGDGQ